MSILSLFAAKETLPPEQRARRLQEKRSALRKATDQWLSLLRDMEQHGQSGEAAYERYYKAYLDAKRQQKAVELDLFNLQSRQVG